MQDVTRLSGDGEEEWVVSAIADMLGGIPVFGGSASDDLRFGPTFVSAGGGGFQTDAAVLLIVHSLSPFTLIGTQHFGPTPQKMVVTAADPAARVVSEINGDVAAEEYARLVGLPTDRLNPLVFAEHPVVVRVGGRHYVRSIQKVNPDGSLTFFCAIDEGIVLTIAEGLDIIACLEDDMAKVHDEIGYPRLIIGCDCILRRLEIERKGLAPRVSSILAANNVIGFNSYGEHIDGIHVNQTLTGVAIGGLLQPVEGR